MSIISKVLYRTIIGCGGVVERNFNKETKNFKKVNNDSLFDILSKNARSEIGDKFEFKDILSISDFKKKVPLTDYSYYDNYIERMANGEKNILTTQNVEYKDGRVTNSYASPSPLKSTIEMSWIFILLVN